jgi:tricarballylate dehydrogenase
MESCGVLFQPALSGTLSLSRTNAFFLGGGKALINAYYHTADRIGIHTLYDTEVQELHFEGRAVRKVTVSVKGFPATVKARTVVAASGGFQANIEWLKEYWGEAATNFLIRGTPYAKGKVLRDLLHKGAMPVGDPTQCHALAIDARAPKFDGGIVTRLDCIPFSIVVNKSGERFYDEGEDIWPKRYAIWGLLLARQPQQIGFSIFDSKSLDRFMPSVFPPVKSDTIAALATQLGIAPAALEKTVSDYNAAVKPGNFDGKKLDHCHTQGLVPPKSNWALRLEAPPFYSYPLRPGITFTYLGVKVDHQARVLMDDGKPTDNVFAAGEMMAGNILGRGYLAGLGMAIGTVFGRIAGSEAAKIADN